MLAVPYPDMPGIHPGGSAVRRSQGFEGSRAAGIGSKVPCLGPAACPDVVVEGLARGVTMVVPAGTMLAVPYPDMQASPELRTYQIFLKSEEG